MSNTVSTATTKSEVTVNKRPWELPLAILLWLNVVGFGLLLIFLLMTIGDSSEPLY